MANSNRPAFARRVVLYDLNDNERALLQAFAAGDKRSISEWASDAIRAELNRRSRKTNNRAQ